MASQREDLRTQLKLIDKDIRELNEEKENTSRQIQIYRSRIESGPKIEQMYVDLRRGYDEASENYQSLLAKQLQAELAKNLERTQKGEQFRILDPANLPQEPFKPNIPQLLALGLVVAIGMGVGMAFLREYLDASFWSRKEVESVLELPVLVSIPIIQTQKERRWKTIKMASTVCILIIMSSALLYALFVLWKKNPTLLPI
jgi:capsular polysaccharide biosynthesis protein